MELFYKPERDKDFYDICERIRKQNKEYQSVEQIASKAVHEEAQSFYLTQKQIVAIIQEMRAGVNKERVREFPVKSELYNEIFSRYWKIKKESPEKCVNQISKIIDEQSAPRFYISEARATSLYYKLLKCNI